MGFPKFIPDRISLSPENGGWRGEVFHRESSRLLLVFKPAVIKEKPVNPEDKWDIGELIFQLRPPARGPEVQILGSREFGNPETRIIPGYVDVTIGEEEPAAGLLKTGTALPGAFEIRTGAQTVIIKPDL